MLKKCQIGKNRFKKVVLKVYSDILNLVKWVIDMAKKKKKRHLKRMFLLSVVSIFVIGSTTYATLKYWVEIYDKYQEKKELKKELVALKEKEEELKVDASKLQDPDYIARYAREKYAYSKDGEIILRIP